MEKIFKKFTQKIIDYQKKHKDKTILFKISFWCDTGVWEITEYNYNDNYDYSMTARTLKNLYRKFKIVYLGERDNV